MATSSDVILTSRAHSSVDLTNGSSISFHQTGRTASSQPGRLKNADSLTELDNAAACYGIDTVHSWATESAGNAGVLKHHQSFAGLQQTVCFDTAPAVHKMQQSGRATVSGSSSIPDFRVESNDISLDRPVPPPRTKHKARAHLSATFNTSPDDSKYRVVQ